MDNKELVKLAMEARKMAYTPYSHWQVGAALLAKDGRVFLGCNIENASYGATNCAERTAFFKAVSEGKRDFSAIAICGGKDGVIEGVFPPCGVCRQVMLEFCDPEVFEIILVRSEEDYRVCSLQELLPYGFGPANLV